MFSILVKINADEDISGKKDGNLKTLMLGLQIHISLTASNATISQQSYSECSRL
jgi:hypothetical protein